MSPLVVQEEDAENVETEDRPVEVLPPKYQPAWGRRNLVAGDLSTTTTTPVNRSEKERATSDKEDLRAHS